jgi:hypothetical protein
LIYVLIESSKGFASAFFTYGLNKDTCYVSNMHYNLKEFALAGVKIISYKTFFFYMIRDGLKCDKVVLTEKIFNIKSWLFCFLLRAGEVEYLDNLAVQDCTWQDFSFLKGFLYINSSRLALLQATNRISLRYLLWFFRFLSSYPFLFIIGFRVIILNNSMVGYRMPLLADKSLYWDGSVKNLQNLSLSGIIVLMPLASEPKANAFYSVVADLTKQLLSFSEIHRTQIYLKPHPRSDDSFLSFFDDLAGNFELVSKEMPLEMYDLKKAILLTHRTTTDIKDCLAFFCFGEFLGLSKKEIIGVRASMVSYEDFLGFVRLNVE